MCLVLKVGVLYSIKSRKSVALEIFINYWMIDRVLCYFMLFMDFLFFVE